jgi:hypothetical protein
MINGYYGTDDICFDGIESAYDVYEVLDALHSKAMENCGAVDDITKTSEALEICNKLLEYVGFECENLTEEGE